MSKAKVPRGISVSDVWKDASRTSGKRWLFRVRDPVKRVYVPAAFDDKAEGLTWAKEMLAKLTAGVEVSTRATVTEVGASYLASLERQGRTERHRAQVQQAVDAMVAAGADDMKHPLFPDRIEAWLSGLKAQRYWQKTATPASPRLRNKFLIIAKAMVRYAMDRRILAYDPLAVLKPRAQPKAQKGTFTVAELRDLLHPDRESDRWFLFTALGAYTGCRSSEIAALRWSMVDQASECIRIPPDLPGNKTKRQRRITLQPELWDILKPHAKVGNVLIVDPAIAAMEPPSVTVGFQDYARRCGIDSTGRGPHALRHTVAAIMTAQGVSPFLAMDNLGHMSATVAKDYAAAAQEYVRDVETWGSKRFYLRDKPPVRLAASR